MWIEVMRVAKNGFRACLYIGNEVVATTPFPETLGSAVERAQKWAKETQIFLRDWKNPRLERSA